MAVDITQREIGAGVFSIGAWVTAGGAGTLVDIGLTGPVVLGTEIENVDLEGEQAQGALATSRSKTGYTLKVPIIEMQTETLRKLWQQPAANKTGTTPNFSLLVGESAIEYFQATLVRSGMAFGTTGVHTHTFWRLVPMSVGEITFSKIGFAQVEITFRLYEDLSVATADKFFKRVIA